MYIQAQQEVAQVHTEVRGTREGNPDGRIQKKEKKKKPKKVTMNIIKRARETTRLCTIDGINVVYVE